MSKIAGSAEVFLQYLLLLIVAFLISSGICRISFSEYITEQTEFCNEWTDNNDLLRDWDWLYVDMKESGPPVSEGKSDMTAVKSLTVYGGKI